MNIFVIYTKQYFFLFTGMFENHQLLEVDMWQFDNTSLGDAGLRAKHD